MKVLFITSSFPRYKGDYSASWLLSICKTIKEKGSEVEVLVPSYKGLVQKEFEGITINRFRYCLSGWETLTHEESFTSDSFSIKTVLAIVGYFISGCFHSILHFIRGNKYDVIYVHWPIPNALFGIIGRLMTDAKIVYYFHGLELLVLRRYPILKVFFRLTMIFADRLVANSNYLKKELEKELNIKANIEVIPMPPALNSVMIDNNSLDRISKVFNVLFVGRLIERKGVMFLLEALKLLGTQGKDIVLTIVGDGLQRTTIEEYIKRNDLSDNVVLKGRVQSASEELVNIYKESNAVVVPSISDSSGNFEALGCVAIESLIMSKPVIVFDHGGLRDVIIDKKTGFVVPEKDVKKLAEIILYIKNNKEHSKEIAKQGCIFAKEHFSVSKITDNLLGVLE